LLTLKVPDIRVFPVILTSPPTLIKQLGIQQPTQHQRH
jgi:hypothetical protein